MAVNVNIGRFQHLNSLSDKTYVLPSAEVHFSSAFNTRICPNKFTNPCHGAVSCVKSGGSSSLCVYDNDQVPSTELLPSQFSQWEIFMPRDRSVNVGAAYKLALPSLNATNAVDLNVIVMLKLVRVVTAKTTSMTVFSTSDSLESVVINAVETTCCAAGEHFAGSSCAKCPDGSTGALNGYTCQRN